jgi:hypothetical protein
LKFDAFTVAVVGAAGEGELAGEAVVRGVTVALAEATGELVGDPVGVGVFVPPSLEHEEVARSITPVNVKPRTFSIFFFLLSSRLVVIR